MHVVEITCNLWFVLESSIACYFDSIEQINPAKQVERSNYGKVNWI